MGQHKAYTDVDIASLVVNFRYLQRSSPEDDPATHGTSLDFSLSDLAIDNLFLAKYSALKVNKVR
jgi:hypothetical protein